MPMTETKYLSTPKPMSLFGHLREGGGVSDRKWRLFAVACHRRIGIVRPAGEEEESLEVVALAERYADGAASAEQLEAAAACRHAEEAGAAWIVAGHSALDAARLFAESNGAKPPRPVKADLLRELAGNPFQKVALDPRWLTPAAASLARAAYDERLACHDLDPVRLSILADALEEAGCVGDVLAHLRSPGPHVRGCWALDLVLGLR